MGASSYPVPIPVLLPLRSYNTSMVEKLRGMVIIAMFRPQPRNLFWPATSLNQTAQYTDDSATFQFASRVKTLLAGGVIDIAVDHRSGRLLRMGIRAEPWTMFENIRATRRLPGSTATACGH